MEPARNWGIWREEEERGQARTPQAGKPRQLLAQTEWRTQKDEIAATHRQSRQGPVATERW
eukprot:7208213-Heterocapsa_arctica.AAC.1